MKGCNISACKAPAELRPIPCNFMETRYAELEGVRSAKLKKSFFYR